jgi:predicted O-linked N-acetylglucosamine transferase (SPINDLY family)
MLDINGRIRTPNYFETLLNQPAPIQVNWYNLPCTVGVKAFNYAITDEYCVHPDEENLFVEKVFRMPTGTITAWDMGEPPVASPAPFQKNKQITFGCFGDFFKINEEVLATWAEILKQVPDSKLYLKGQYLRLEEHRARIEDFFSNQGIYPSRLMLEGMSTFEIMKKCYGQMDIALDTFPYSSGSTTINALWQGVPVIAINGSAWRERSTAAVLAGCGLDEFIANDRADYIRKAVDYARQPSPLLSLRTNLGMHLLKSPQWQTETFARNFETVLRQIWHHWLSQFHAI